MTRQKKRKIQEEVGADAVDKSALEDQVEEKKNDFQAIYDQMLKKDDSRSTARLALLFKEEKEGTSIVYAEAERIVGKRDFVSVNFLSRMASAARAVCCIRGIGTGFLVAPGLLLTNNHVLSTKTEAMGAYVDFNFELDDNFVPKEAETFRLRPQELFLTNKYLDYTFVAIERINFKGSALEQFGYLTLESQTGKAIVGEYVSIIQHPDGRRKEIVLRENEIVEPVIGLDESSFVQYVADTEPGSSGSPVLNDQHQVVALHHKGIIGRNNKIVNQGVRISAIVDHLSTVASPRIVARTVLKQLGLSSIDGDGDYIEDRLRSLFAHFRIERQPFVEERLGLDKFADRRGYNEEFLGAEELRVPVPVHNPDDELPVVPGSTGVVGNVLKYTNHSLVMHNARKFCIWTAVNIDGSDLKRTPRIRWRSDPRVEQYGDSLYNGFRWGGKVMSRGHIIRRYDASWGDNAKQGNEDTFFFTNATPQELGWNGNRWGDLEDMILDRADASDKKVCVLTGPAFFPDDIAKSNGNYRHVQIPSEFWKIVVGVKNGELSAQGFWISQHDVLVSLQGAEEEFESRELTLGGDGYSRKEAFVYQYPISSIATACSLTFAQNIIDADTYWADAVTFESLKVQGRRRMSGGHRIVASGDIIM